MKTQTTAILDHLLTGRQLTAIEALDNFGCFRLAARICDLKDMGYIITGDMIKDNLSGKSYKSYRMEIK